MAPGERPERGPHRRPTTNTLPTGFPELILLVALLFSVVFWNVIRYILTVIAVLVVLVAMAGYGLFAMMTS